MNEQVKLYNAAVGIPAEILADVTEWQLDLKWSKHAQQEAVNDRYGRLPSYPQTFAGKEWQLVEVEVTGLFVSKIVVRRPADARRSLVLVILRDGPRQGFVKTCWTNLNTDNHRTLDTRKFTRP